jgi:hypothetical protein
MKGYRGAAEQTAEAIDGDGWLHTGDVATIDADGYVRIVDRKKELIINAAGKNMSPANIETTLKGASPLIGQACAIGDRRAYNTALIVLDADFAPAWAGQQGISDTSLEALAALKPAFLPDGKVTAGNSSQICDGAAAVLVASERAAGRLGLEPRARFVSFGLSGVDPYRMLHGNPQACAAALARAGLTWDDMSVIEVNEAFASVALQFARDAGLDDRWGDVNPNGGGISLGHPLGATGARITATLINELDRREARYGIATMCIGFGQAIAGVVERL